MDNLWITWGGSHFDTGGGDLPVLIIVVATPVHQKVNLGKK